MILVDTNILLYATIPSLPLHAKAKAWLDAQLNGASPVALPWPVLLAFLRITTNPRVFERPIHPDKAWKVIDYWLRCPVVWVPHPKEGHAEILKQFFSTYSIQGNLVPDAHLAVLALEHGLVLCSTDSDFARFRELRWQNPLVP